MTTTTTTAAAANNNNNDDDGDNTNLSKFTKFLNEILLPHQ